MTENCYSLCISHTLSMILLSAFILPTVSVTHIQPLSKNINYRSEEYYSRIKEFVHF
jgi:hypothetical protein